MTTSNCFSRALSLSTMSLEHFEALSTASPAPLLAATVLLMEFHPDTIETHTKEQRERRKKHDLVSRHLYFPATGKHNFCISCLSSSVSEGDSSKPDTKTAEPSCSTQLRKNWTCGNSLCHWTTAGLGWCHSYWDEISLKGGILPLSRFCQGGYFS